MDLNEVEDDLIDADGGSIDSAPPSRRETIINLSIINRGANNLGLTLDIEFCFFTSLQHILHPIQRESKNKTTIHSFSKASKLYPERLFEPMYESCSVPQQYSTVHN